jgi:transcriptional regulator with XRE-family HTH domain
MSMSKRGVGQKPSQGPDPEAPQLGRRVVGFEELGSMIQEKRRRQQLTLEAAAQHTGVSAATLSRLERRASASALGREMPTPDVRTLSAIADWLGVAVAGAGSTTIEVSTDIPLPNVVEAHLRADRNLDSDTAALLARMFRAAYMQATQNGRGGSDKSSQSQAGELNKESE